MTPSIPPPARSVRCERCGAVFECSNGGPGCWCEQVALTGDNRAALADNFNDCLCGNCLRLAAGHADPADPAIPDVATRRTGPPA